MEKKQALWALRQVAQNNGVSLAQVIQEIDKLIEEAMHSDDPAVRAQWEQIPREGAVPTAVEVMVYLSERLADDMRSHPPGV